MDGKEYLEQISSAARPKPKSKTSFISSPIFKVIVGGVVAFVLIAIIGAILSGSKKGLKEQAIALKLQIDSAIEVIGEYQPSLKSSDLRSSSASLRDILSNTNQELQEFLQSKYNYKSGNDDKNLKEEIDAAEDVLKTDLFQAKINGILDRIYAHKMAYQISTITTKEASIINSTSNEELKSLLTNSYTSLSNLYGRFSDFSETK